MSPLDYVLLQLGNPGRYQIFIGFLLSCLQLPISFSTNLWMYYAEEPPHRCFIKPEMSNGTRVSEWIPRESSATKSYSSCTMFVDVHNQWKGTQRCVYGWEYKPYEKEHSIIIEWDLVCERKYLSTILFYMSHVFAILGGLVFGFLADKFERKRILLVSLYLFVSVALSIHFAHDYITFSILYCLQSFFVTGILITSYILLLEIMPTAYQLEASLYIVIFGIISTSILPLLMWTIRTWRYVQLAIVAPGVVFFTHLWILPQSPLWLLNAGKLTALENLIENLSGQNGKLICPSFRLHIQNFYQTIKTSRKSLHPLLPKFSSPCIRWYLLVNFYLLFVTSLSVKISESQVLRLHESKYVDNFFRCMVDLGTAIILYYFAVRLGPRSTQSLVFVLAGLLMMGAISLQEMLPKVDDITDLEYFDFRLLLLPSTLVAGARTLLNSLPGFIWYHIAKTLPTGVRATGFSCCYAWSIIAEMASPNLLVLAQLIAPFVPIGLCGSLSVVGGALTLLFPNCWHRPLPCTLEEAENKSILRPKSRYASLRSLNAPKLNLISEDANINTNVYTMDPVCSKTSAKGCDLLQNDAIQGAVQKRRRDEVHPRLPENLAGQRPSAVYSDDTESKLSDFEDEFKHGNWRLYSQEKDGTLYYDQAAPISHHVNDLHIFTRAEEGLRAEQLNQNNPFHVKVAETNL